jgi:signal transduction histidine kinase
MTSIPAHSSRHGPLSPEGARRRLAFLDEASRLLATSLDTVETLAAVANLAVPTLADWCSVDLLEDGKLVREPAAMAHVDPAKAGLGRALRVRHPVDVDGSHGIARVIRSGRPELIRELTPEQLANSAGCREHLEVLQTLGLRSVMLVPLSARGRVLGVLSLVSAESGRLFDEDDLALAVDLARRAAVALDNARLHQAEAEARRRAERVAAELEETTRRLEAVAAENARLYEEARRALAARDDLLAIVSHDLRNPLGAIVLNTSVLERLLPAGACEEARRQLRLVQRSAQRMNRLVGILLDAGSLGAGVFALEPAEVPAARLVEEAVEASVDLAEARAVDLAAEPDLDEVGAVRCDRERVLQVFSNLVANAIRFSPSGATVSVGCAPGGEGVRFWVRDRGPGVPPELRERIFERHFQVQRGPGSGLGLGLYIARGIVASHGGRIWCEPAEGGGTSFVFTLPAA